MNALTAIQDYVVRMLDSVSGMKVLLLDEETMGIISMVFSQSEVLQKEVYLFELLDSETRESMMHLKAICFVRPTAENIRLLTYEIRDPNFGQYHMFFTNVVKDVALEELARADEHEVVHQVQEFFADYYAVNPDTVSLGISSCVVERSQVQQLTDRIVDGLSAVLLSVKKKPLIRFEKRSHLAGKVATELSRRMDVERSLFDMGSNNRRGAAQPVLLILDRCSDPVTPLLMQFTYQAMVHELIGIKNNRVLMGNVSTTSNKVLPEIVLSAEQDPFYSKNVYSNFGDLAINIKAAVSDLQKHSNSNRKITTIDDMKEFISNYPEYQKLSGNVTKHISLLDTLMEIVQRRKLMPLCECEQDLACHNEHGNAQKVVGELLKRPDIGMEDKLKVLLIYALRYETNSSNHVDKFLTQLFAGGDPYEKRQATALVKSILEYGGAESRSGDLFGNKTWLGSIRKTLQKGMQGAVNVYTQHKPILVEQIDSLVKGKLNEAEFPFLGQESRDRPTDVIVFYVGGATFEEATAVHDLNEAAQGAYRVLLGGTSILNSRMFLREMKALRDLKARSSSGF